MNRHLLDRKRNNFPPHTLTWIGLIAVSTVPNSGCQTSEARRWQGMTRTDRLVQAYPELESGRFLILADFEDPQQRELFRLIGTSDQARRSFDPHKGRAETGLGCLTFTSGSPNDTIIVGNASATQWYMKQDWRAYDLLMLAIYAPQRGLSLELSLSGGPVTDSLRTNTTFPLQQGWSIARFDLAQIGEHIPLDDVREIQLAVSGHTKPVEIRFDDLLLTAFRHNLLGDAENRRGGLYVQQIGRRWRIGAKNEHADFELTFAQGQIVEWFNMKSDPYRLKNLARGTALSPTPVRSIGNGPVTGNLQPQRTAVRTHSKIIEMNAARVRIACEWRYPATLDRPNDPGEYSPSHRWVYTIYPSGQVFVSMETPTAPKDWTASRIAVCVGFTPSTRTETPTILHPRNLAEDGRVVRPAFATARDKAAGTALLFIPWDAVAMTLLDPDRDDQDQDHAQTASQTMTICAHQADQARDDGGLTQWTGQLLLIADEQLTEAQAEKRAIEYALPNPPRLEIGMFAIGDTANHPNSPSANGFDPAAGCYVIAPDNGNVRFRIDDAHGPHFSPIFEILNPQARQAWVYVNHMIFDRVTRTPEGHLLFQLPGIINQPTLVEILFRRKASSPAA